MTANKPWRGELPTLEEAAALCPDADAYILGTHPHLTRPAEMQALPPVAGVSGGSCGSTNWEGRAVVITAAYYSHFRGREVLVERTLIQIVYGSLAGGDGTAWFETYECSGALDAGAAQTLIRLAVDGQLPRKRAGGEL